MAFAALPKHPHVVPLCISIALVRTICAMASGTRSGHELDAQLPSGWWPAADRGVQSTLKTIDRESIRAIEALRRQLRSLRAQFRPDLEVLVGGKGGDGG